jgi:hypothetical protein
VCPVRYELECVSVLNGRPGQSYFGNESVSCWIRCIVATVLANFCPTDKPYNFFSVWFKIEQVLGTKYEWQLIEKRRARFKNIDSTDLRVQ